MRHARTTASALCAAAVAAFAGGVVLLAIADHLFRDAGYAIAYTAMLAVFSGVGWLVASRQPRNATGWIFCAAALTVGLSALADGYARYWLDGQPASKSLGEAAAVFSNASWIPLVLVPATVLLLRFPDGHLLSRRWRPIAWCAGVGVSGFFVTEVLTSATLEDYPEITNPYAVQGAAIDAVQGVAVLCVLVALVGSLLSLFLRLRRSGPVERQQIKWLVWAGAVAVTAFVVCTSGYGIWGADVANAVVLLTLLGLPLATGAAILRYRLYDIDVVINRTLVYAALTATLAGAYVGCVLLLQLVLSLGSDLAIAASTLAVAALFRPARGRIQDAVDRRFYRRKYDAQRTLETFSARLREEVDLAALSRELNAIVRETLQPAQVSLWLRERRP